eukprot:TRINITY_DN3003_c0_g3_i2.p1 TRINITY_DN3003_c0_g3~~TRINITY_DN3003_c0_g3_i2.p1  ORF type:complete len:595 (-),score=73.19 TRINITY_DN3003_c0_g3_i2:260-2044(-)
MAKSSTPTFMSYRDGLSESESTTSVSGVDGHTNDGSVVYNREAEDHILHLLRAPINSFPRKYGIAIVRFLTPMVFASVVSVLIMASYRVWKDVDEKEFTWQQIFVDFRLTLVAPALSVYSSCICFPNAFSSQRIKAVFSIYLGTVAFLIVSKACLVAAGCEDLDWNSRKTVRSIWELVGYLIEWCWIPYYFARNDPIFSKPLPRDSPQGNRGSTNSEGVSMMTCQQGISNILSSSLSTSSSSIFRWSSETWSGFRENGNREASADSQKGDCLSSMMKCFHAIPRFFGFLSSITFTSTLVVCASVWFLLSIVFELARNRELLAGCAILIFCLYTLWLDRKISSICHSWQYLILYLCFCMTVLPAATVSLLYFVAEYSVNYVFVIYLIYSLLIVKVSAVMLSITRHAADGTTYHTLFMVVQVADDFCGSLLYLFLDNSVGGFYSILAYQMFRIFVRNTGISGGVLYSYIESPSPVVQVFNLVQLTAQSLMSMVMSLVAIMAGLIADQNLELDGSSWVETFGVSSINQVLNNYTIVFAVALFTFYFIIVFLHRQWMRNGLDEEYGFWAVFCKSWRDSMLVNVLYVSFIMFYTVDVNF